jgi:hypothetical protein
MRYNGCIRLVLEIYMDICLFALINVVTMNYKDGVNSASDIIGIISFVSTSVINFYFRY